MGVDADMSGTLGNSAGQTTNEGDELNVVLFAHKIADTLRTVVAELLLYARIALITVCQALKPKGLCRCRQSMEGKTVIVTGATSGIGQATAMELARLGARVIIACRNLDKARGVAQEIFRATQREVVVKRLDLCSFASVRHFCEDVMATESRLDVLINNAGAVGESKRVRLTEDGYEVAFQSNYLGPFLLTVLLLELLKKTAPSRIVNVSSSFHVFGRVDSLEMRARGINDLKSPPAVYGNAKLALNLFTFAMADRLQECGVTVNCLHPGGVRTSISDNGPALRRYIFKVSMDLSGKTPLEGAQTSLRLAIDPTLVKTTGKYFVDCVPTLPSKDSRDRRLAEEVFLSSVKMLPLKSREMDFLVTSTSAEPRPGDA